MTNVSDSNSLTYKIFNAAYVLTKKATDSKR